MKRHLIVLTATLMLLAAACAEGGAGNLGPAESGSPTSASSGSESPSPSEAPTPSRGPTGGTNVDTVTYEVWFGYGEWLFETKRTEPFTVGVGTAAVTSLLAGPSEPERAAGVGTSIPAGTRLLGLSIDKGIATVDLTGGFASGGGSLSMFSRLAQLTYTLTQFPTVHGVDLKLDGRPTEVFSGEGIVLDRPMTRLAYQDLLPPILVENPLIGEEVSSPVTVAGTADVFEATVSISILGADGREIGRTFTQATCGTGCRGTYSKAVQFVVAETQPGTIRVFEVSAKDGRPIHIVDIPVVLED